MTTVRESVLLAGGGFAIFAVAAGMTSAVLNASIPFPFANVLARRSPPQVCKTIATDPNPPLNVRSSPVVAPDNIIGKLNNGVQLTVVDENQGWLRISAPIDGWVYKELTVTSCVVEKAANPAPAKSTPGADVLSKAAEDYQSGNLEAAIALVQTIPPTSPTYDSARQLAAQWQRDWATAEAEFRSAEKALKDGRWQDVLNQVERFPENRFWRGKLAPLVKTAMQQRQNAAAP